MDWAGTEDRAGVAALDRAAFGADRAGLIAALFDRGRVAVIRAEGRPIAWAARRDFGRGEVVGPVIAPDAQAARALLSFLFADRTGGFLRVDADEATGLGPWLAAQGLAAAGGGLRMTRGGAPASTGPDPTGPVPTASVPTGPDRVFALASQVMG